MPSAPISATPDVMALLCLIGRVMRGMGPSRVGMQLLTIGVVWPAFGSVLRTWLDVEEHVARAPEADEPWWGVDRHQGWGAVRSGWISRSGAVWRWRQVTRSGARVMLVRWFEAQPGPDGVPRSTSRAHGEAVVQPVWRSVFLAGLAVRAKLCSYCYVLLMSCAVLGLVGGSATCIGTMAAHAGRRIMRGEGGAVPRGTAPYGLAAMRLFGLACCAP